MTLFPTVYHQRGDHQLHLDHQHDKFNTPRPRAALLMCLKQYSATENSAIGNYVVLCSKFTLKTVLLEDSYGKND